MQKTGDHIQASKGYNRENKNKETKVGKHREGEYKRLPIFFTTGTNLITKFSWLACANKTHLSLSSPLNRFLTQKNQRSSHHLYLFPAKSPWGVFQYLLNEGHSLFPDPDPEFSHSCKVLLVERGGSFRRTETNPRIFFLLKWNSL